MTRMLILVEHHKTIRLAPPPSEDVRASARLPCAASRPHRPCSPYPMRKHSQRERSFLPILLLGCTALSNGSALAEFPPAQNTIRELPKATSALRGKYLADAGNCVSCHTRRRGPPFTGGVSFETPFGTIYSSNITPDPDTGIGNWTANDLVNAMHRGVGPGAGPAEGGAPYLAHVGVVGVQRCR